MKIIRPPKLNHGDTVGIVSPSQPVTNQRHYWRSVNLLKKLGFRVVIGKNALKSFGYRAGTIQDRVDDLHTMFASPRVKAIFASTGGYSSLQLLPFLDFGLIKKNPKIFCGFSDLTTLLNAIWFKTGLITFYNFSIERLHQKSSDFTFKHFLNLTTAEKTDLVFPSKSHWRIIKTGAGRGRLIGGNLLTFANNLGIDKFFPHPGRDRQKYILAIEEHGDDLEALENTFYRLGLYGVYDRLAGLIVGKITDIDYRGKTSQKIPASREREFRNRPLPRGLNTLAILKQVTERFAIDFPVIANVDFGYVKDRITLPLGALVTLKVKKDKSSFRLNQSPVKH